MFHLKIIVIREDINAHKTIVGHELIKQQVIYLYHFKIKCLELYIRLWKKISALFLRIGLQPATLFPQVWTSNKEFYTLL
jgi:hypothetical protein